MKDWTLKRAADRAGTSIEEYIQRLQNGEKWCPRCQVWKIVGSFSKDKSRKDGFDAVCATCRQTPFHSEGKELLTKDADLYKNDAEMDTHLLAYFAGVIDSDGYITIYRGKGAKRQDGKTSQYYALKVGCNQVDQMIPALLRDTFGGNLYTFQTKHQGLPWFMWSCSSQQAAHCCSLLLPYLHLKKTQAELSIQFNTLMKTQYQERQGVQKISEKMEMGTRPTLLGNTPTQPYTQPPLQPTGRAILRRKTHKEHKNDHHHNATYA